MKTSKNKLLKLVSMFVMLLAFAVVFLALKPSHLNADDPSSANLSFDSMEQFSMTQGYANWYYGYILRDDDVFNQYGEEERYDGVYGSDWGIIWPNRIHPSTSRDVVKQFKVPFDGVVNLSGFLEKMSGGGCDIVFTIYKNGIEEYTTTINYGVHETFLLEDVSVVQNDTLNFKFHGSGGGDIWWNSYGETLNNIIVDFTQITDESVIRKIEFDLAGSVEVGKLIDFSTSSMNVYPSEFSSNVGFAQISGDQVFLTEEGKFIALITGTYQINVQALDSLGLVKVPIVVTESTSEHVYNSIQDFSSNQGNRGWYYLYNEGEGFYPMVYNGGNSWWNHPSSTYTISDDRMFCLNNVSHIAAKKWVAPFSGTIDISSIAVRSNLSGSTFRLGVYHYNSENTLVEDLTYDQDHPLFTDASYPKILNYLESVSISAGDYILFTYEYVEGASGITGSDAQVTQNIEYTEVTSSNVLIEEISILGSSSVSVGSSITLTASILPLDADIQSVTWSVVNTTVSSGTGNGGFAYIDEGGVLSAFGAGTVTVVATAADLSGVIQTKEITITSVSSNKNFSNWDDYSIINGTRNWFYGYINPSNYDFTLSEYFQDQQRYDSGDWGIVFKGSMHPSSDISNKRVALCFSVPFNGTLDLGLLVQISALSAGIPGDGVIASLVYIKEGSSPLVLTDSSFDLLANDLSPHSFTTSSFEVEKGDKFLYILNPRGAIDGDETFFLGYFNYTVVNSTEVNAFISALESLPEVLTYPAKSNVESVQALYSALTLLEKGLVDSEYVDILNTAILTMEALVKEHDDNAAADNVIVLINQIGVVSSSSGASITLAREAYNNLTADQKALVSNYSVLTQAETAYILAVEMVIVQPVIDLIASLPEVIELSDEESILAAREAYDNLTEERQLLVSNLSKLIDAEIQLVLIKEYEIIRPTIELIDSLPEVITLEDEVTILNARNAYNLLTSAQKGAISNYSVLVAAEATLAYLKEMLNVTPVINLIDALPAIISLSDENAIINARNAYNALSTYGKSLVTNEEVLVNAENALVIEKQKAAAKIVVDLINLLPEVITITDENTILEIRSVYNALSAEEKAYVTNYSVFEQKEIDLQNVKNAIALALPVITSISLISTEVTLSDKQNILTARALYNALTASAKAYVTNYSVLVAAEAALAGLELDKEKIDHVIEMISSLPSVASVTLNYKNAIDLVQSLFDELTQTQKDGVTNIAKLLELQAKIAALELEKQEADKEAALEAAKVAAIAQLDNYKANLNYSASNLEDRTLYLINAKLDINNATSVEEISQIVLDTKALIDNIVIETIKEETDTHKDNNVVEIVVIIVVVVILVAAAIVLVVIVIKKKHLKA
ncbi:MAG: hypothetical protein LBV51_04455 [Acholeplasmatales bacterium]|jgi:hypothetical protein|nr:hypothetical protein [Acholeplasmatales bacterium]